MRDSSTELGLDYEIIDVKRVKRVLDLEPGDRINGIEFLSRNWREGDNPGECKFNDKKEPFYLLDHVVQTMLDNGATVKRKKPKKSEEPIEFTVEIGLETPPQRYATQGLVWAEIPAGAIGKSLREVTTLNQQQIREASDKAYSKLSDGLRAELETCIAELLEMAKTDRYHPEFRQGCRVSADSLKAILAGHTDRRAEPVLTREEAAEIERKSKAIQDTRGGESHTEPELVVNPVSKSCQSSEETGSQLVNVGREARSEAQDKGESEKPEGSIQDRVEAWHCETFGHPVNTVSHLAMLKRVIAKFKEEANEFSAHGAPEEAADCVICLLAYAARYHFDLMQEVERKFAIVKARGKEQIARDAERGIPSPDADKGMTAETPEWKPSNQISPNEEGLNGVPYPQSEPKGSANS